jgi:hypothetical protein
MYFVDLILTIATIGIIVYVGTFAKKAISCFVLTKGTLSLGQRVLNLVFDITMTVGAGVASYRLMDYVLNYCF